MRKFSVLLLAAAVAVTVYGCVPTERTNISIDPVISTEDNAETVELEFDQIHNDTISAYENENPYAFITDVDITGDNNARIIYINAECVDGVDREDADRFLAACMRHISEAAAGQYMRFAGADETTFGPLWDMYALEATVKTDDEGAEPVEKLTVPAGGKIPFSPDIETYEKEWEKAVEIYLRNVE